MRAVPASVAAFSALPVLPNPQWHGLGEMEGNGKRSSHPCVCICPILRRADPAMCKAGSSIAARSMGIVVVVIAAPSVAYAGQPTKAS